MGHAPYPSNGHNSATSPSSSYRWTALAAEQPELGYQGLAPFSRWGLFANFPDAAGIGYQAPQDLAAEAGGD